VEPQKHCVSIFILRVNVGERGIITEKEADVFFLVDWLIYNVLVQKFLSLNFVWRVAPNKFRKLHFKNPIDV
jgi:hypothetical protein